MKYGIDEFHKSFMQDVWGAADVSRQFAESSFVEIFAEYLQDAGEIESFDYTPFRSNISRGLQIDGYSGDPADTEGVLTLVISDFNQEDSLLSLVKTDIERIFRKAERFLSFCLKDDFYVKLEESSPGYGLAQMINERKNLIRRVRMIMISNRILSERVYGMDAIEISSIPVTYNVWDISRLYRMVMSGKGKEDLDIDLSGDFNTSLPCLPAHLKGTEYEAYLTVVPGKLLADIYDRWGARLLEQNVRCFLQFRGKVNKGIRNTIQNEPEMFFAYNNGITATAEEVETSEVNGTKHITKIKNLQIVNGGQTTASIFTAHTKVKSSISNLFVQMKLSIIDPDKTIEVVPRISEYANTQNKVNAADFFANHPFHIRVEQFSRRIYAPSPEGTFRESKWFYERARGQYLDAQSQLTPAQKKKFSQEYPRKQLFTKTDLAKFENVWERIPHIVSRGAQYNFAQYAKTVGVRWDADHDQFNEHWYKCIIAKAIIFKEMEKIVSSQPWYDGGYRANIVAYSIAKLADIAFTKGKVIDFEKVWQRQALTQGLYDALVKISGAVHGVIINTPEGMKNVTEWAKKEGCWDRARKLEISIDKIMGNDFVSVRDSRQKNKEATKVQKIDNDVMAQAKVVNLGSEFWKSSLEWCRSKKIGSSKDIDIMLVATKIPAKIPSGKQSLHLMTVLEKMKEEGCPFVED